MSHLYAPTSLVMRQKVFIGQKDTPAETRAARHRRPPPSRHRPPPATGARHR
jgi:hypothetical protein